MKKKQTKSVLKIKENWSKNLTLSSNTLANIKKGGATKDDACTGCGPLGGTVNSLGFGCPTSQEL